jgi:hypothetical protein
MTRTAGTIILAASVLAASALACAQQEPALSPAQQTAVSRQIATLKSSTDRHVAGEWSNAKKVAELLCRPAALPVLKKQIKGVDRVFLGTDAAATLHLESDRRLSGTGQFRTPQGWQDFTFTCDLNPDTGRVSKFSPVLSSAKP